MRFQHLLVISLLLISGCQTKTDGLTTSTAPPELSEPAANVIASDMAGRYAEQADPVSSAPILLHTDGTEFAIALESALKGWGYTVVTDEKVEHGQTKPVELAYLLVNVDGQVFARLSTASMELARAYRITATGASPSSPLSLMKRS